MKKKLLVFSHSGVVAVNRALYQELARTGEWDIRLVVPRRWRGNLIADLSFGETTDDREIALIPLPVRMSGKGSLFFYPRRLSQALRGWRPDCVLLDEEPWSVCALQVYASFPRAKKVFYTKENLRRPFPPPFSWIQRWVFSRSDAALSVAPEVTAVLRDFKRFRGPIHFLPHSVDPAQFCPASTSEKQELRRAAGIPVDRMLFGYFGRLTQEKGIEDALSAIKHGLKSGGARDAFFIFVGDGKLGAEVEAFSRAEGLGQVKRFPALPHGQIAGMMRSIDVLLLPSRTTQSWKEQFGRVLIEALACRAALIGSDSGEIPHLIRQTGGGVIFPERSPELLWERIRSLTGSPDQVRELADRGYRHVAENFTHAAVAARLSDQLKNIDRRDSGQLVSS